MDSHRAAEIPIMSRGRSSMPHPLLAWGTLLLSALKCAICPVCLGAFGSAIAGARLGLLVDEQLHGAVMSAAIVADAAILAAFARHYRRAGPLLLCSGGSLAALVGHFTFRTELLEYAGFALLMTASLWNMGLIWRHRHGAAVCCAHELECTAPATARRGAR